MRNRHQKSFALKNRTKLITSMYTTHSPHTDICVPDNGRIPSGSTGANPFDLQLRSDLPQMPTPVGLTPSPARLVFWQKRTLSLNVFSYQWEHTMFTKKCQELFIKIFSLFLAPFFRLGVFSQALGDLRILVGNAAGILHVAATLLIDKLLRCFGLLVGIHQSRCALVLLIHVITPLLVFVIYPLAICGNLWYDIKNIR